MKNIIKNITLWSAAGLMLFSCSKEKIADSDGVVLPAGQYPIEFSAQLEEATTKALVNPTPDLEYLKVLTCQAPVVDPATDIYTSTYYGSRGAMLLEDGDQQYWQSTTQKLGFRAYTAQGFFGLEERVVVAENQDSVDLYFRSDFVYASLDNVPFSERDRIILPFKHHLSRVVVTLKSGNALLTADHLAQAQVSILGTNTQADFDEMTGALSNLDTPADILMFNRDANLVREGIVIPQSVFTADEFFQITVNGINYFAYIDESAAQFTFESGKQYNFEITVNLSEVSLRYTITDWQYSDDESAELQNTHQFKIGDYFPDPNYDPVIGKGQAPIGVVFYLDDATTGRHGQIVSLKEYNSIQWCNDDFVDVSMGMNSNINGRRNLATFLAKINELKADGATIDYSSFPAMNWVVTECNNGNPNGIWFLPSRGELQLLYNGFSLIITEPAPPTRASGFTVDQQKFNDKITAVGGAPIRLSSYWSSTEKDATSVNIFDFNNDNYISVGKTSSVGVRAIANF